MKGRGGGGGEGRRERGLGIGYERAERTFDDRNAVEEVFSVDYAI